VRVVIDTNVFISSFFGGKPSRIIEKWISGEITLCMSNPILREYFEVLNRFNFAKKDLLLDLMKRFEQSHNILFVATPHERDWIKADPADNKFIACAISLKAQFIISGDKHLRDLKTIGGIRIVSPSRFLEIIS